MILLALLALPSLLIWIIVSIMILTEALYELPVQFPKHILYTNPKF